jgi:hypothetical protein
MNYQMRMLLFVISMLLSGCIHTVSGPGYAQRPEGKLSLDHIRVVYAGKYYNQPQDFLSRLERTLVREFKSVVTVEQSPKPQFSTQPTQWPAEVSEPRVGELTVLICAQEHFHCGTGPFIIAMFSLMTLGIFPFADGDTLSWRIELYDGPQRELDHFDLEVRWSKYGWLPLVPLTPLNIAWRWLRGSEHDYFVRALPSHLHAHIAKALAL